MLNDKDDKFDGQEESEYHFSDEDVTYDVEPESSKPERPPAAEESGGAKTNFLTKFSQSKRLLISGAVFILLIFVVYKMVSPTAQAPQTEITAQTATPRLAPMPAAPGQAMSPPTPVAQVMPAAPPQQVSSVGTPPAPSAIATQAVSTALPPPGTQTAPTALPQPVSTPIAGQVAPPPPSGIAATQLPQPGSGGIPQAPGAQPVSYPAPPLTEQQQVASQNGGTVSVGMPSVIPVQSPIPTTIAESNAIPPAPPSVQPVPSELPQGAEVRIATLQANSEKLMTQLQADYTQKLSEYAAQNKALQDQMQLLSARMAGMESQLSQLLQALARQMQSSSAPSAPPPPPPITTIEQKLSYNVQAIIPGRAWLKSDNGETLTVAEGDVVRDLGRITKINPYDGVVEINTGNKVVSLSYGNGG